MHKKIKQRFSAGLLAGAGLISPAGTIAAPFALEPLQPLPTQPGPKQFSSTQSLFSAIRSGDFFDLEMPAAHNPFYDYATQIRGIIISDEVQRSIGKDAMVPDDVLKRMHELPASTLNIGKDSIGAGFMRPLLLKKLLESSVLEGIKHKPVSFLRDYPEFTRIALEPEISPAVLKNFRHTPEDTARKMLLDSTLIEKLQDIKLDQSFPSLFNTEKVLIIMSYSGNQRAADVISRPMPNPWPEFTHNNRTVIPYSFNVAANRPLDIPSTFSSAVKDNDAFKSPLQENEQDAVRLALQRISDVSNVSFIEVSTLPSLLSEGEVGRNPKGMLFYTARISPLKYPEGEKQVMGMAINIRGDNFFDNNTIARSDVRIQRNRQEHCPEHTDLHEIGHSAFKFSHPFSPVGVAALPGTTNEFNSKKVPNVTASNTVMAYEMDTAAVNKSGISDVCPVSLMPGDIAALQAIFGSPSAQHPRTHTLQAHEAPPRMKLGRDTVEVSTRKPLAQTIPGHAGSTLDLTTLEGTPVSLAQGSYLALSNPSNVLVFEFRDGNKTAPLFLNTTAEIPNAIIRSGTIMAAKQGGWLEVQESGKLFDYSGNNVFIGGTGKTDFIGAGADPNQYVIRAGAAINSISNNDNITFSQQPDTIIAPAGAVYATIQRPTHLVREDCPSKIVFHGADGKVIKGLTLLKSLPTCGALPQFKTSTGEELPLRTIAPNALSTKHTKKISDQRTSTPKEQSR